MVEGEGWIVVSSFGPKWRPSDVRLDRRFCRGDLVTWGCKVRGGFGAKGVVELFFKRQGVTWVSVAEAPASAESPRAYHGLTFYRQRTCCAASP